MKEGYRNWVPVAVSLLATAVSSFSEANPVGGTVSAGAAKIVQSAPGRVDVLQASDRAIVNWKSFSVGSSEHVNFQQPSFQSATLNRVTGGDISAILGRITANGHVFLVNPNGVLFGRDAKIDVGSLIASTANISDTNFMAGRYQFDQPGNPGATIVNRGRITVGEGGLAAFIAPGVENAGLIQAKLGRVVLASGNAFTLDLYGDRLINLLVSESTLNDLRDAQGAPIRPFVNQAGEVTADGGTVLITAAAARDVVDNVISVSGIVRARSVEQRNGEIVLLGPDRGGVRVAGMLDASGLSAGQKGGRVSVLGDRVGLDSTARIDVSGDAGGGTALVGGDYQGRAPVRSAFETRVDPGASIVADALSSGNGGKVIVWANGATTYSGSITANGGPSGGDGGFIEVSGKEQLLFRGDASASAPNGKPGTLLLDPRNLGIGGSGKTTLAGAVADDGQAAVYAVAEDAGTDVTVQASTVANLLNRGTSVTLQASDDLTVSSRIDGRGGRTGASLTMSAGKNVRVNNDILTADGNVNVEASGGSLVMGAGAADSITGGQGTVISAGRGTISLRAAGDVTLQHLLSSTGVEVTSGNGSVNLARGYGGTTFEQGALTVTAANTVDVSGTIRAGGPVKLAGNDVVLRHSLFTNNKSIELGRAGGTVTLDPAGDEKKIAVARDVRTGSAVAPPPLDAAGNFVVAPGTEPPRIVQGGGNDALSSAVPVATLNIETRRITVDAGSSGADVTFLGEVVVPPGKSFSQVVSGRFPPDQPLQQSPNQLPDQYIALDVTAGAGTVRFASGIAESAATVFDSADFGNSNLQARAGRDTLELKVRSASRIVSGSDAAPVRSFVNSLTKPDGAIVVGNFVEMFRTPINIEAFSLNTFNNRDVVPLENPSFPPIFPEPNLSEPFDVSSSAIAFALPVAPFVPEQASSLVSGVQGIDQAVAQSQRMAYETNAGYIVLDGSQDVARSADLGRSSLASGAAQDVFARPGSLVRTAAGASESYQDDPYFRRDVFGQPISEDEERK